MAAQYLLAQQTFAGRALAAQNPQEETLVFPGLLNKEALEAGNPLATYAAMLDLEPQYQSLRKQGRGPPARLGLFRRVHFLAAHQGH